MLEHLQVQGWPSLLSYTHTRPALWNKMKETNYIITITALCHINDRKQVWKTISLQLFIFANVVCKISAIMLRPPCVKILPASLQLWTMEHPFPGHPSLHHSFIDLCVTQCTLLTRQGRLMYTCVCELDHHRFIIWALNHCWLIVDWAIGNKFQWNLNWNIPIFIQENQFENVIHNMAAILSLPLCVNSSMVVSESAPMGHFVQVFYPL